MAGNNIFHSKGATVLTDGETICMNLSKQPGVVKKDKHDFVTVSAKYFGLHSDSQSRSGSTSSMTK